MDKHTFVVISAVCADVHYLITILVVWRDGASRTQVQHQLIRQTVEGFFFGSLPRSHLLTPTHLHPHNPGLYADIRGVCRVQFVLVNFIIHNDYFLFQYSALSSLRFFIVIPFHSISFGSNTISPRWMAKRFLFPNLGKE